MNTVFGRELSRAEGDVLLERHRQVTEEGWVDQHDDQYQTGELVMAGGAYALFSGTYPEPGSPPPGWPWDRSWWKPGPNKRRDLVKAAALFIAEIERMDRADLNHETRLNKNQNDHGGTHDRTNRHM